MAGKKKTTKKTEQVEEPVVEQAPEQKPEVKTITHNEMLKHYLQGLVVFHKVASENGSNLGPELTHELAHKQNLELSAYDLGIHLLKYRAGQLYVKVLSSLGVELEKHDLMKTGRNEENKVIVRIPDWNIFVTALDLYYRLCGPFK